MKKMKTKNEKNKATMVPTLSAELQSRIGLASSSNNYGLSVAANEAESILLPAKSSKSKKKKKSSGAKRKFISEVEKAEVRKRVKKMSKKKMRKLQKLKEKKEADIRRAKIFEKLKANEISREQQAFLASSGAIGQKGSTRERVKQAYKLQKIGVPLSAAEADILYVKPKKRGGGECNSTVQMDNRESAMELEQEEKKTSMVMPMSLDESESATNIESVDETREKEIERLHAKQLQEIEEKKVKEEKEKAKKLAEEMEEKKIREEKEKAKKLADLETAREAKRIAIAEDLKRVRAIQNAPTVSVVNVTRTPEIMESRKELPVCGMEQEIIEAVNENDVIILCGATGSGKTTQTPQFLYEAGFGTFEEKRGMIGVTQPRRVAAMSMARRVAEELNTPVGRNGFVAHHVRYDSRGVSDQTKIKFMTEGILLQEGCKDLLLRRYSVIVIDEAHERNVDTDILLGLLSRVVPLRRKMFDAKEILPGELKPLPPLKLVIMSATLKVTDFTENHRLFPFTIPVLKADARQFPVSIHFNKRTALKDYMRKVVSKVGRIHTRLPAGTILVFMPGKKEIEWCCRKLRRKYGARNKETKQIESASSESESEMESESDIEESNEVSIEKEDDEGEDDISPSGTNEDEEEDVVILPGTMTEGEVKAAIDAKDDREQDPLKTATADIEEDQITPMPMTVLPMYSMLPKKAQMRVFDDPPPGHRLVVVATNVAESSITIPNTVYVVDSGRERRRVYNTNSGISTFEVGWISKASADQRAGRAGRTGPGHAYRMYSSAVFNDQFPLFQDPEIVGVPLEDVVMHLKRLGVHHVSAFPFPTAPPVSALRQALNDLWRLGLLDVGGGHSSSGSSAVQRRTTNSKSKNIAASISAMDTALAKAKEAREARLRLIKEKGVSSSTSRKLMEKMPIADIELDFENLADDGKLTALGKASSKFPVSSRFGKMLALVNNAASSLECTEYVVALVAALSTQTPFFRQFANTKTKEEMKEDRKKALEGKGAGDATGKLELELNLNEEEKRILEEKKKEMEQIGQWAHFESDALALLKVVGAFAYAPQSFHAQSKWCESHGLRHKTLREIQMLRHQLSRAAWRNCLKRDKDGKRTTSEKFVFQAKLSPPSRVQENFMRQVLLSGYLDQVACRFDNFMGGASRTKGCVPYQVCNVSVQEEVYVSKHSFVSGRFSKSRSDKASKFLIYNNITRSTPPDRRTEEEKKDAEAAGMDPDINPDARLLMRGVTVVEADWLVSAARGSPMLRGGDEVLMEPPPFYDSSRDVVRCWKKYRYGPHLWDLPLQEEDHPADERRFEWFARLLLEGKIICDGELGGVFSHLRPYYAVAPRTLTTAASGHGFGGMDAKRVLGILRPLRQRKVDSLEKLVNAWRKDKKFLFKGLTNFMKKTEKERVKRSWTKLLKEAEKKVG
eukprot:g1310.t1